jgi:peptidoglycan hydrolase-like protein with peptidoglycan-binding domain
MALLLKTGSTGKDVRNLQIACNFLQVATPPLSVDGIFGPKTQTAVLTFQRGAKLTADGLVGPITAQAITNIVLCALITRKKFF